MSETEFLTDPALFQHLLQATREAVWYCTSDGARLLAINPAAEQLFGRSAVELKAAVPWWRAVVHPHDAEGFAAESGQCPGSAGGWRSARAVHPDGQFQPFEYRIVPVAAGSGPARLLCGLATALPLADVSLESVADARAAFRSLTDSLPLNFIIKDLQGRRTFANRRYCEQLGQPESAVLGKTDLDLFPPAVAHRLMADDAYVINTGETLTGTEEVLGGGRARKVIDRVKAPLRNAEGTIVGVQVLMWDITEDVSAREALRATEAHHQSLVESLPLSVFRKDEQFRLVFGNKRFCETIGIPLAEFHGLTDFDLFPYDLAQKYRQDDVRIMETGETIDAVEEILHGDDQRSYIQTLKAPVRDADGRIIGVQGMFWDVTEKQMAAEALRRAKEAADAASKAKSDFLANMSHEIRTPMNAVMGMTELLLDTPLTQSQRESLMIVQESGDSLLSLINDLLDFSKIESGKFELDYSVFNIRDVLGDTLKSLAVKAVAKGLELAFQVDNDIPQLLNGDFARLRQIVINLVGNAIKFTLQGEVVLRVRLEQRDGSQALIHVVVSDTGIGIPKDKQQLIFEEFQQVDASTTRTYGGTGLGLAICSRLVGLMQGRVWVESEPGQGSTFHFTARMEVPADDVQQTVATPEVVAGARVLIVDDNNTNRRILGEMTLNWGMLPALAPGAREGLDLLREAAACGRPFGLVLSDVNMPDYSGFTLAEWIRSDPQVGQVPIIMLTSSGRDGDAGRRDQLKINMRLMKPIKQSELFDAIVTVLGVAEPTPVTLNPAPAEPAGKTRPLRILLAEDNLANQKLAIGVLSKQGHQVTVAGTGKAAVEKWEAERFDLILMDVQMPEMDGLEATQAIRRQEAETGRHITIIAMTAHAMTGDREHCLSIGMDDYLSKPIRARQIAEKLFATFGGPDNPVTPVAAPQPPLAMPPAQRQVDWEAALEGVDGDRELLCEVVQLFLSTINDNLATIRVAISGRRADGVQRLAHTLKGELLAIGAAPVADSALKLEQCGRAGTLDQAETLLGQLEEAIRGLRPALMAFLLSSSRPRS